VKYIIEEICPSLTFSFPDSNTSNTTPLTASIDTPPSQPSDREYYYTTNPHMLQIGGG